MNRSYLPPQLVDCLENSTRERSPAEREIDELVALQLILPAEASRRKALLRKAVEAAKRQK